MTDTIQHIAQRLPADWLPLVQPVLHRAAPENGLAGTPLQALYRIGIGHLANTPLPSRRNEDWKYTPVREILRTQFVRPAAPESTPPHIAPPYLKDAVNLVFYNGHFVPGLSDETPDGVWFGSLEKAARELKDHTAWTALLDRLSGIGMTTFEAMTTSMATPGIVILVSDGVEIRKPLHCVYLTDTDTGTAFITYPYKFVHLGRAAHVTLMESFTGVTTEDNYFTNAVSHILMGEGATMRHYRLQRESLKSFHINATQVFQARDSHYAFFAVETGARLMRNNISVHHEGTNITSDLYGTFITDGNQHSDTQSFIDHAQPHCVSNELYKGILRGRSRGVFNGKIMVRPDAQKTNAFQQNSSLLLSPHAVMDSKPQLEIFADDVRCSHGATIGQLDEETIFYLRTRGLSPTQASALLQKAFAGEILDKMPDAEIREYFSQILDTIL